MFFRSMLEQLNRIGAILLLALIIGSFLYFVIAHKIGFKYCKKLFGTRKIVQQSQEIPLDGNLFAACYIRTNQPRVVDLHIHHELMAAFLYRWYMAGKLKLVQLKPALDIVNYLSIEHDASFPDQGEEALYQRFLQAAGEDRLLDEDKVYDWSYAHPGKPFGDEPKELGKQWFEVHGLILPDKQKGFLTTQHVLLERLSPEGAAKARGLVELQNYLQAQTENKPCDPVDPDRIDDYLCYGQLFGNADKLAEVWSSCLTEEKTIVVGLCRDLAEALFDGNNNATD